MKIRSFIHSFILCSEITTPNILVNFFFPGATTQLLLTCMCFISVANFISLML